MMIVNHFSLSQICQLRAETLDKEKDFRQKLLVQQKSHTEVVELLQVCSFLKVFLLLVLMENAVELLAKPLFLPPWLG